MALKFASPLLLKSFTIAFLTLVLLWPLAQVRGLVDERAQMRNAAGEKVAAGWGGLQSVGGAMLYVPVDIESTADGRREVHTRIYRVLAQIVSVSGSLAPEQRHVGIYTVQAYVAKLRIQGAFESDAIASLEPSVAGRTVRWGQAKLFFAVSDLRGIREVRSARWGDKPLRFEPDRFDTLAGLSAGIDMGGLRSAGPAAFDLELDLAGTRGLRMLPLARTTTADLSAYWPHPGFEGSFLPASYKLSAQGFSSHWQVLELNRGYPQSWMDSDISSASVLESGFGVNFYQPVDTYQRNERAIKYALLFIAITFMSVFLWEQMTGMRLHPFQYLLVGLALCVFYLLLLALSEHVPFGVAYLLAAVAHALLIGVYMAGVMRARRAGAIAGGSLTLVFGLMYLLILSEQYALLLGAVLLFAVLAGIMLATRRTDWYRLGTPAPE